MRASCESSPFASSSTNTRARMTSRRRKRTVFGHEESELDELAKALDANPGAVRDLLFG